MDQNNSKVMMCEKILKRREQEIDELENMLKSERAKVKYYETKIENIYEQYRKFQQYKEELKLSIKLLQENLICKEEKIVELESMNIIKENQSICLSQVITDKENEGESFGLNPISYEVKSNESVFKRIFNNKNIWRNQNHP